MNNLLIGVWNYSDYKGNTTIFKRNTDFSEAHCYKFNADGTLIERKIAGWCGTPPISYSDYAGTWKTLNDTIIEVTSDYWGGTSTYRFDIESVTDDSLNIIFLFEL